ncbi:glycosyltransferase family 8 protein [Halomonas sabkhae]|uniref:glycosyltransferase family 8 protein n=1 Tax=Halomonas sabkhae TaxID=626223 RepID=UPI0025B537F3|nr:glycosyltransferase family 8 protein [Halomonas sabkhae]MDN3525032.1 glycosyltransferase family 8 protein [Halomonas sabkhae]
MNILLCADEAYIDKAATVMASVLCHASRPAEITFHLLGHDVSTASRVRLEAWFANLPASLRFTETLDSPMPQWQTLALGRFGPAAMLRLSMEQWLPAEVASVVYLDCDVLVLDDIARLGEVDLQSRALGAVMNLQNGPEDRLGTPHTAYFNSGLLLVDLERWRSRRVVAGIQQRLAEGSGPDWRYPDQDALNLIFPDWRRLPLRWNMQPYAYPATEKGVAHYVDHHRELVEAVERPAMVHFIGATKPWHGSCRHPLAPLFHEYMRLTPWAPTRAGTPPTLRQRLRRAMQLPRMWRRRRRLRQAPSLTLPVTDREAR